VRRHYAKLTKSDLSGKLSVDKAPSWLIEFKIRPRWAADAERLVNALAQMASQDMRVGYSKGAESGELIARVFDEQHVEAMVDILKRRHNIEVNVGAPRVAYRETLVRTAEVDYTHKKQTGGTGQFARVKLRLEPKEAGKGNDFASEILGGVVPMKYIPGVEKGVKLVWDFGVLIGVPMVDIKVTLFDGAYHEADSSTTAFEIAARQAMREGCEKAGVKLLEPIMDVEVVTPGEFVGGIVGDLKSRSGVIRTQETRSNAIAIRAYVPLVRMLGYERGLRSIANGLGSYVMSFSHYAEVPGEGGPDDFRPTVGMRV